MTKNTRPKNFYDYPKKERLKVIKKATEESMKKQAETMTNPNQKKGKKRNICLTCGKKYSECWEKGHIKVYFGNKYVERSIKIQ